jgi:hypothetical protein
MRMEFEELKNSSGVAEAPPTEVVAKRRRFAAEYKERILSELDGAEHGQIGAILRREGLYSATVTDWRKERGRGLAPLDDRYNVTLAMNTFYSRNARTIGRVVRQFICVFLPQLMSARGWACQTSPISKVHPHAKPANGTRSIKIARSVLLANFVIALTAQVFAAGAQWTRLGLTGPDWIVGAHGDTVMAVSRDSLYVTTNAGYSWELRNSPETKFGAHSACSNDLRVVYGVGWKRLGNGAIIASHLYRSSDAGTTWDVQCDLVSLVGAQEVFSMTVSWANENVIFAITRYGTLLGCVRSDDGGRTWRAFGDFNIGPHWFQLLYAQDLQDSKLFVAIGADNAPVPNQALYYSSDDGNTWEGGWPLPRSATPNQIVSGYPFKGDIFVAFGDSASSALWHTSSLGTEWDNAGQAMGNIKDLNYLGRICPAPGRHGALFATANYRSSPNLNRILALYSDSLSWSEIPWFDSLMPYGALWDPSRASLYVSTDSGVFRMDMPTLVVQHGTVEGPSQLVLGLPFPTPSFSVTRFPLNLGNRESALLRVYDIRGREVVGLRAPLSAATHEVVVDVRYLASGSYYAEVEASHAVVGGAIFKVR